jgi:hypothetical protein
VTHVLRPVAGVLMVGLIHRRVCTPTWWTITSGVLTWHVGLTVGGSLSGVAARKRHVLGDQTRELAVRQLSDAWWKH